MKTTRRGFLVGAIACAGCGGRAAGTGDAGSPDECLRPSDAGTGDYCLVSPLRVRVPMAAKLAVGEAVLFNVDDNNAVILARDDKGLYARSGICTHACCIVSLCADGACDALTPTPLACKTTDVVQPDPESGVVCPCHGSTFRIADGSVTKGPARLPLPAYAVEIQGNDAWVDTGTSADVTERA